MLLAVAATTAGCRSVTGPAGARPGPAAGTAGTGTAGPPGRLPDGGRLVVTTDNGVRLRPAGPDGAVRVDGGTSARWTRHGATWLLDLDCPAAPPSGAPCPRMPTVQVPAGAAVTVAARNAGVDAAGLTGTLDLATVNGDVTVEEAGGAHAALTLATRNGSVRATAVRALRIGATTVNGDVVLGCAAAPRTVTADTTNGSVGLTVPPGTPPYAVTASTGHGPARIALPTTTGGDRSLTLHTVNGEVTAGTS